MGTSRYVALLVIICACGDDAAPRDATTVDIDNGSCGSMVRFTGEYVDWDSGAETGATFCGVFGAQFQVEGGGTKSTTAPNGRFDLCVPDEPVVLLDITPPTAASQCQAQRGTYTLPGIAVANKAVITAGGFWSGRDFVMSRQAVDPTKAQVLVHVNGTPRQVSISASYTSHQARMNDTWSSGDTGEYVLFLDVDPTSGSTDLSMTNAIGTGSIPLVAGKMTNVSIIAK